MDSTYTTLIDSRGWHVYMEKKPRKNEVVQVKKEINLIALEIDPCAIAFTRKSVDCLVPVTVGHIPLDVSRLIFFFMERGGILEGKVYDTKCQVSPIPKGGLEIVLEVTKEV